MIIAFAIDGIFCSMGRSRKSHPLVELPDLPWWASVLFAATVYAILRWLAPVMASSNAMLRAIAEGFAANAWWIAGIFLLPLPFAVVNRARRGRLLDGQASIDTILALSWQDFEKLVAEA